MEPSERVVVVVVIRVLSANFVTLVWTIVLLLVPSEAVEIVVFVVEPSAFFTVSLLEPLSPLGSSSTVGILPVGLIILKIPVLSTFLVIEWMFFPYLTMTSFLTRPTP